MKKYWMAAAVVTATALMMSGCGGAAKTWTGTDSAAADLTTSGGTDQEPIGEAEQAAAGEQPGKADREKVEEQLAMITSYTRASGTKGENEAAEAIGAYLQQLGYETRLDAFDQKGMGDEADVSGSNVVAVKRADANPDKADILYITAHHDAKPGIQGAEDDAAGVTVLLETARLLSRLSTDTELRFVSFGGEEPGRVGSRFHVEQLTPEERSRVIGDIQLDDLGYKGSEYLQLSTVDGKATMLGDMLSEQAQKTRNVGRVIPYIKEGMSDHNSFHTGGMPAVMLGQDSFAFENHSTQDQITIIDPVKLEQTAQLVADVAAAVMSQETGSYQKEAYAACRGQIAYEVQPDTVLQFDMNRNYVENMMSLSGTLLEEGTNEYQDKVETWSYPIIWFGMDEPIETKFYYRNDFLETIEIPAQEALGADIGEAKAFLEKVFGKTAIENEVDAGIAYSWEKSMYHRYDSLEPTEDGSYHLLVMGYTNVREYHEPYDLSQGFEALKPESAEDEAMLELVKGGIAPEDRSMIQFRVYTDGINASTGVTGGISAEDNSRMDYALDYADALREDGSFRNYNKTLRTAVHEYGHAITLNQTQVDITRQDADMPSIMYDQETYAADSYMRAYYEKFWKDLDVKSGGERYQTHPDEFVSAYASTNASEDIAESFMLFVLSSRPTDDSIASEKIRFFYDYAEMVARRDYIRGNFGIEETNSDEGKAPELKAGDYRVALDGNPTTGYIWAYTIETEGIVEEAAAGYYRDYHARDLVGAGGTYVFDFRGMKEGTTEVTFSYLRPWESVEPSQKKVYRLTVDSAGNVTGEELRS
ncbi:MAG: M28 family peptidase [Lachnospiraceae bacterium]|nr:M28 family peptidase [Lachnospiraceae bacterium]